MTRLQKFARIFPTLAMSSLAFGALGPIIATADDAPPVNSATDAPNGRHHNPAWAACKKQADDQKIAPGDAHKEFMRSCIDTAKRSAPPAS